MIRDRVAAVVELLRRRGEDRGHAMRLSPRLANGAGWRPFLVDETDEVAWHIIAEAPDSNGWLERIERAVAKVPGLQVGVAVPKELVRESIIEGIDRLDACVVLVEEEETQFKCVAERRSVLDAIYERRLQLGHSFAQTLLTRALSRAVACQDSYRRGALLETLLAVLFSQVPGWEVTDTNLRSVNQEVDVNIVNRVTAGPLGRGQYVLVEAKNWSNPVPRKEYNAFTSKMRTRRGMVKLGLFVTTGRFEQGCYTEHIGERYIDDLVVLINGKQLESIWKDYPSIEEGVEDMVRNAVYDHEPVDLD